MLPAVPGVYRRDRLLEPAGGERDLACSGSASPAFAHHRAPATARTAAICWGRVPGSAGSCLIRVTVTGVPEIAEAATARRRTPAPSFQVGSVNSEHLP